MTTIQKIAIEKTPVTLPSLPQNYHDNLSNHGQEKEKNFLEISICKVPDRGVQKSEASCAIMT